MLQPVYQKFWGSVFDLTHDQKAKSRFDNTMGGYCVSSSVGGMATGEGGSDRIIDDPHNVLETEKSEAKREDVLFWWREVMSTRVNAADSSTVVVQQRVHEEDLAGFIMDKEDGWVHLDLPMEHERKNHCMTPIWSDPRRTEGELLWPGRFDRSYVEGLKKSLGPYEAAAQLQQKPAPRTGGIRSPR